MSKNSSNQHDHPTFSVSTASTTSVLSTCSASSIFFMNDAPSASITCHESTLHPQTSKIKHASTTLSTMKRTKECKNKERGG